MRSRRIVALGLGGERPRPAVPVGPMTPGWWTRRLAGLARHAAVVTVCLLPAVAIAQPPLPQTPALRELSLEQLGDVEVTSVSKVPETVWQTSAAIHVLTSQDLARSGATTIPDALRLIPGVEVARVDTSRNWVVGIRGFGDQYSKSVLVLVDGRSVYTPLWGGVHWPVLDTILLEDVERIEVIRGPGGTIWGANAQNGVVNIITKRARDTPGIYASTLVGTNGDVVAGTRFGGARGDLDYRAYAKVSRRGPQHHSDGRNFDTWEMGQAGFRVDWEDSRDRVTVQGDAYKAALGESVRVSTFSPPASLLIDEPVDLAGGNVLAQWRRELAAGSSLMVQTYVDHTYRLGTDFGERRTTFDVDGIHHWRAAGRHDVVWGAGVRTSPSRMIQTYSFASFVPRAHTLNLFSVFAQDTFSVVPQRLAVTGGVKLEHNSYTGMEVQPSGRVSWTPAAHQTVWGGLTRAVRVPSRIDEDISVTAFANASPLVYSVVEGNPALEAERVVGLEAGYRTMLAGSVFLDVAAFRNHYDNLVDLGRPSVGGRTTDEVSYTAVVFPWINGNRGVTRGLEITPSWQPTPAFRLRGAYSLVAIDLEAKPGNVQKITLPMLEGATPRHQVTVQSLLNVGRGVQIDPTYRYVSARKVMSVPAYHTADLRVGIRLPHGVEVSLVGQNLLDRHHAEWARDPGPTVSIRRSAYLRVTLRR